MARQDTLLAITPAGRKLTVAAKTSVVAMVWFRSQILLFDDAVVFLG